MIARRWRWFGSSYCLCRHHFLAQTRRIIVDENWRHCCHLSCCCCGLWWRVPWRCLGATDERVWHVDGHLTVRASVVSCPIVVLVRLTALARARTTNATTACPSTATWTRQQKQINNGQVVCCFNFYILAVAVPFESTWYLVSTQPTAKLRKKILKCAWLGTAEQ